MTDDIGKALDGYFRDVRDHAASRLRYPRNHYGQPITPAEYFDGEHVANAGPAGGPPVCSCGWTRFQAEDGSWFELSDHLRDMGAS